MPTPTPGATFSPPTTVRPRIELDGDQPRFIIDAQRRYEAGEPVGKGGAGEVLMARDWDIGRKVAP